VQFCNEAKSCAHWLVNETLWYETETRPRHLMFSPRRDRDLPTFPRDRDVWKLRLETETSRPRLHPWIIHIIICLVVLQMNVQKNGNWTTRTYANSQIANLRTSQLVDWTSCGLDSSRTSQVAVLSTSGLVNSWMLPPTVLLHCYVSVGILQII